ncbi:cupin domain-containing protein [Streptomyces sp. SBT349]|uniref:cupin domain-containing protein n=1 Tax=Streptomyces sp. SBT349 TaxID=1580539 RepID=UPI00099CC00C|nr:cupin domain-containing protein [Streptomyces sp. SBT349]
MTVDNTSRAFGDVVTAKSADITGREAFPRLTRRVLAFNDTLMLVEHVMEAGSVFPLHSHPHEQLAYLISGHIRVRAGDEEFEAVGGDSFVLKGDVEHQVIAVERSVALDIFTPYREDYAAWAEDPS